MICIQAVSPGSLLLADEKKLSHTQSRIAHYACLLSTAHYDGRFI